jgi:hypothetical protein
MRRVGRVIKFSPHEAPEAYLALAFAAFLMLCLLVIAVRGTDGDPVWKRIATIAVIVMLSPLLFVLAFALGLYIWPVLALCVAGMILSPLQLLTRRGRNRFMYTMRWGYWKDHRPPRK